MLNQINNDLTSVWTTDDESLECRLPNYNPETMMPFSNEAEVIAYAASIEGREFFWSPKLSDEEKAAIEAAAASKSNVARAKAELLASDWSDLPSVRNTAIYPHLVNADSFDAYRAALRAIVVVKPTEVSTWPVMPDAAWSDAP
jgi:hypothetical protein